MSASGRTPAGVTIASARSSSVRARARGNPGVPATGAKYVSALSASASKRARAATAWTPSPVVGDSRSRASSGAASRAASCVRLNRYSPNVAPRVRARSRTKSSAAPREADTISTSAAGGDLRRKWLAASSRAAADEDETIFNN